MDSGETFSWPKKRKKVGRKENAVKKMKVEGCEHVNHVGKRVPAKQIGPDCNCTRFRCFDVVSQEQRQAIFCNFYGLASKELQDSYLAGLINVGLVKQRRSRREVEDEQDGTRFAHDLSFSYKVREKADNNISTEEIPICAKAFLSIHAVTRGRLRTVQQSLKHAQVSPKELRGKHKNRPKAVPQPLKTVIEYHIKMFKPRHSHYSFRKNPHTRYLPEDLNVSIMHKIFLQEYQINVPYKYYWEMFNTFNIRFGYPRADTCSVCDAFKQSIRAASNLNESQDLSTQRDLHLRKAEAFYQKKRLYKQQARQGLVTVITFDFMQNLPLPHLQTNAIFYARQLWFYVFGIHDLANDDACMYTYHEGVAKRGQNEVTSFLFDYLKTKQDLKDHLVLISDGCAGQNKNFVMMMFLYFLVHSLKMFKSIKYLFPVRGHSFLPNDQDFALISNHKKTATVELPNEWSSIIEKSRTSPTPFTNVNVSQKIVFDMKNVVEPYFKKAGRKSIKLKALRMYKIESTSPFIKVRDS